MKRSKRAPASLWAESFKPYGVSLTWYLAQFAFQRGVCAICKKPETRVQWRKGTARAPFKLSVDHDHKTGLVRGLLCGKCNRFLGWVERPRPDNTEMALYYINQYCKSAPGCPKALEMATEEEEKVTS